MDKLTALTTSSLTNSTINEQLFWILTIGLSVIALIVLIILFLLLKYKSHNQQLLQLLNQQQELTIRASQSEAGFQQQLISTLSSNHQVITNHQFELKNYFEQQLAELKLKLLRQQADLSEKQGQGVSTLNEKLLTVLHQHQQLFTDNQNKALEQLMKHLNDNHQVNREEQSKSMLASSEQMTKKINELTLSTDNRLKEISEQVEKRLADGFEKTTKTFNDIVKRLALIDDAQKKITELSTNVVSLQEVLSDKRSRGAFGEVQLNGLIRNVLPEQSFSLQHTLSNGKIADCALFLPKPTGTVIIDSKFPLESYRKMTNIHLGDADRKAAERQFKLDIKKHIKDISEKYIIENETSDGAIMFIPAEAIFAEIHGHHSDLVEIANQQRIWLTSPTTLMAILTTARSVLKDEATKEQIHIIQAHLGELANDFSRFRTRFDNLAKHIDQAATDVKQIHTSANKISNRFIKIEEVDLTSTHKVKPLKLNE
ncbi:DNA recombination protein RmuC [Thalassotalea profundi]|uniref:RmuC family protein n=1 Tax=Thalassotalea profundi TaxID=2036687 RepID=A0ABQ3IJH9_9GAMM|nr:DNA recombination protein RmuC [Thalassotalea profundi]GHE85558.1 RmuC family protein [Thalassotalea profundi]